jgi:prepilin-type N-terminal cleavage/methylation domain-containing protein
MHPSSKHTRAFTLIELLVTMTLVAILAGIAYPVIIGVMERARKAQAKNDLTEIVTAVNAYYTEYGKYPLVADDTPITSTSNPSNADLFNTLRAVAVPGGPNANDAANPRKIVFIQPPVDSTTSSPTFGAWFDPWGSQYQIAIDGTYDNRITNPYNPDTGAGPGQLTQGVIGWSLGKDRAGGGGNNNSGISVNDILSWQ